MLCIELELDPSANNLLSQLSSADAKFFSCSLAKLQDEFNSWYDIFTNDQLFAPSQFDFGRFRYNVTDNKGRRCIWSSGTKMPAGAVSPRCSSEECFSDQTSSVYSHNLMIQQHVQVAACIYIFTLLHAAHVCFVVARKFCHPASNADITRCQQPLTPRQLAH